jgi:glycosyltransferase involved in cell wall biosynthesis
MKRVLVILPYFNFFPLINGGMNRYFHIVHQLSINSNLTVLTLASKDQIENARTKYLSLRTVSFFYVNEDYEIPKILTFLPKKVAASIYSRILSHNLLKSANGILLSFYQPTIKLLKNSHFDAVLYENLATLDLAKRIKKIFPKIRQIYDAHNFDSEIALAQFNLQQITKSELINTAKLESNLYKYIDNLWVCSKRESELFEKANNNKITSLDIIPNGTEIQSIPISTTRNIIPEILFVGSLDYYPNEEGLIWFLKNVLPYINKSINLKVIGSGKSSSELNQLINLNKNVQLIGFVESLDDYYLTTDIVIIPIISGSGTRLKALEAMKFQKAIVTTSKGIEGIEIIDEVIIEDDPQIMAKGITDLLDNSQLRSEIGFKAKQLVENSFDWNVIGKKIKSSLES